VFRAFKGMRRDQNVFHRLGDRIGTGAGKGVEEGRDLKPLVDGSAIRNWCDSRSNWHEIMEVRKE